MQAFSQWLGKARSRGWWLENIETWPLIPNTHCPILCFGKAFPCLLSEEEKSVHTLKDWNIDCTRCIQEWIIWCTYRRNLSPPLTTEGVQPQGMTTDAGWGCMIRSAQTMLATSFLRILNTQNPEKKISNRISASMHFHDEFSARCSIYQFVQHGWKEQDLHPGDWYGPTTLVRTLSALPMPYNLSIHHCKDACLYYSDMDLYDPMDHVLLLFPIRIGLQGIQPHQVSHIVDCLTSPWSVGIVGGKPRSSLYFFGWLEPFVLYMDPHVVLSDAHAEMDYPEPCPGLLPVEEMDPSMILCYLIQCKDVQKAFPKDQEGLIHVGEKRPDYENEELGVLTFSDEVDEMEDWTVM